MTDIDEAFLAERERIRWEARHSLIGDFLRRHFNGDHPDVAAITDAVNHQQALIDEIRRLRKIKLEPPGLAVVRVWDDLGRQLDDVGFTGPIIEQVVSAIDEIRRLRDLLTRCAKELPVNQDPTTFGLLREFEP